MKTASHEPRVCLQCGARLPSDAVTCPDCNAPTTRLIDFQNSDARLLREGPRLVEERKRLGLEGLVGGLEFVVINTEPEDQRVAVAELLSRTGLDVIDGFLDAEKRTVALRVSDSADVLVTSRTASSPFATFTDHPKSRDRRAARLETLAFACTDLDAYEQIQRGRGIEFMSEEPIVSDDFRFLQTVPSRYTGNSIGLIEWRGTNRSYRGPGSVPLDWAFEKPPIDYLAHVGRLDHAATRVRAADRDAAILEFIGLTNYHFEFAIYVRSLNSITNVARLSPNEFAMVFTSGIAPLAGSKAPGPTEGFIRNYGPRVHHLAWDTDSIDDVYAGLKSEGQAFLLDLVGSPEEGLKQTFSEASPTTLLVNEYIHRFGDFDGFFSRSNVTLLTEATKKQ